MPLLTRRSQKPLQSWNRQTRETVSEKQRIKADVRKEMCGLALAMTGRFADQADPQRGEVLLEEALKERW